MKGLKSAMNDFKTGKYIILTKDSKSEIITNKPWSTQWGKTYKFNTYTKPKTK